MNRRVEVIYFFGAYVKCLTEILLREAVNNFDLPLDASIKCMAFSRALLGEGPNLFWKQAMRVNNSKNPLSQSITIR